MRGWLFLLLIASPLAAQTTDLKMILDTNEANFKAIQNVSYAYRIEFQDPTETPPIDTVMYGHYRAADAHHRIVEEDGDTRSRVIGKPGFNTLRRRRQSVMSDSYLATWMQGTNAPIMIYDFEDPDAIPRDAYDMCFGGFDTSASAALGTSDGPLRSMIEPMQKKVSAAIDLKPMAHTAVELTCTFGDSVALERSIIIDPQRACTIREKRVFLKDGKTPWFRSLCTVDAVADHPGVWFPTTAEEWLYDRPQAGETPRLLSHTKVTFSNVSVGAVKAEECTLEALHPPDAWAVARKGVDGTMITFYTQDGKLIDSTTAIKSGLQRRAMEKMYHIDRKPTTTPSK